MSERRLSHAALLCVRATQSGEMRRRSTITGSRGQRADSEEGPQEPPQSAALAHGTRGPRSASLLLSLDRPGRRDEAHDQAGRQGYGV
jgi:hypothetical protein